MKYVMCLLLMLLTSCSHFSQSMFSSNKDKTHLSARSIPPLKVPPGIANSAFHETYPVPQRRYSWAEEDVSVSPPGL